MTMSGKERILDCIFCVLSISQNGVSHSYEFWAAGGEHLLESLHPRDFPSILNKIAGVAWRLARGRPSNPLLSPENRQTLVDPCCAGASTRSESRCVGHDDLRFSSLQKATLCP